MCRWRAGCCLTPLHAQLWFLDQDNWDTMPLGEAEEHIGRPMAVSGAESQDITYGRSQLDNLSVPTSAGALTAELLGILSMQASSLDGPCLFAEDVCLATGTDLALDGQAGASTHPDPKSLQQVGVSAMEMKAAVSDTHNPARNLLREAEETRMADSNSQHQSAPRSVDFVSKENYKPPEWQQREWVTSRAVCWVSQHYCVCLFISNRIQCRDLCHSVDSG